MNRVRETFPNALEAISLVICLFAVEFLISAALHDAKSLSGIDPRDVSGAIVVMANGILFSAVLYYKGIGYSSLFHSSNTSVGAVFGKLTLPILFVVPGLTLVGWTIQLVLIELFPLAGWEQAMFEQMMSNGLASVVTTCLIAPLVEEMLFRGVILRSFLCQYSRWNAILGSAFLFGLAHLNIYQFVAGAIAGAFLGWLYERTRSLWPSILLHSAYNSAITIIYYSSTEAEMARGWQPSLVYWATAFTFAFIGTTMLQRLLMRG